MNQYDFETSEYAPEDLKALLWIMIKGGMVIVSLLVAWIGMQRGEILVAKASAAIANRQRDSARAEMNAAIQACNERLAKVEAARGETVNERQAATPTSRSEENTLAQGGQMLQSSAATPVSAIEPPVEAHGVGFVAQSVPLPARSQAESEPSSFEIANFVRTHLGRMMGPVEPQLADYASVVDFHDKPRASLQTIRQEREQWAEKWPRRIIAKDEVSPLISIENDPAYGWRATATFQWRWFFLSRTGSAAKGVYRDTWQIIPGPHGLAIIAEHSVDAVSGRSRD